MIGDEDELCLKALDCSQNCFAAFEIHDNSACV